MLLVLVLVLMLVPLLHVAAGANLPCVAPFTGTLVPSCLDLLPPGGGQVCNPIK